MKILENIFATAQPRNRATAQPRNRATAQPRNRVERERSVVLTATAASRPAATFRHLAQSRRQTVEPFYQAAGLFRQTVGLFCHLAEPFCQTVKQFRRLAESFCQLEELLCQAAFSAKNTPFQLR